jgi:hypothetical protein
VLAGPVLGIKKPGRHRPGLHSRMVELMRKTANSRDFSEQGNHSIQLDTCIVQATNSWFVIIGLLEKTD